jgi:transcriptional regulator with XRE-family HTH domain
MQFDWAHLAQALKAARNDAGITQAELAARARVSEKTVKNLEAGRETTRWPASADAVADALGKPHGWARATALHEATPRRETEGVPAPTEGNDAADASASAGASLPVPVRLAMQTAEMAGYQVVAFDVVGEPVTMVAFVNPGVDVDEQKRAKLRAELEIVGRTRGQIRRESQPPAETDDTSERD